MRPPSPTSTNEPAPNATLSVALALGVLYFVWGSTYLGIRIAVETIPPFYMAATRFLVAGGALYLYLRLQGHPNPTREQWLNAALIGSLLLVGGNGLVTLAQSLGVSSGMAAVVVSTMPLWLALFSRLRGGQIGRLGWVGMIVGLGGIALLNLGADLSASPLATVLLFIAPLSFALGSSWSPSLRQPEGSMASATQMLSAGALFALGGLVRGEVFVRVPSLASSLALLYLITFGSMLAYSAFTFLLNRPPLAPGSVKQLRLRQSCGGCAAGGDACRRDGIEHRALGHGSHRGWGGARRDGAGQSVSQ